MSRKKPGAVLWLWAAVALAVLASLWFLLRPAKAGGAVATIWTDGGAYRTIELADAANGDFSILDETGHNITFRIENGAIRFLSSDCPDKICVNTGFISADNQTAVCMPNRTSITITVE